MQVETLDLQSFSSCWILCGINHQSTRNEVFRPPRRTNMFEEISTWGLHHVRSVELPFRTFVWFPSRKGEQQGRNAIQSTNMCKSQVGGFKKSGTIEMSISLFYMVYDGNTAIHVVGGCLTHEVPKFLL